MNALLQTATEMANSLTAMAKQNDVDLSGLTRDNFNSYLDDAFADGGEVRCEHFADLAWDYASDFGEFASNDFVWAQMDAIEEAIRLVQQMHDAETERAK